MRHGKRTVKLGRNSSHRKALFSNMLKALITNGRIETTVAKAKALQPYADKIVTIAKGEDTLTAKRRATAKLRIRHNTLTPKEARAVKDGDTSSYNDDRHLLNKLFGEIAPRFKERNGGYTRIVRLGIRSGDAAPLCLIEYLK